MKRLSLLALSTVLFLMAGGVARAAVLYDSGPINGSIGAYSLSSGMSTSNSFQLQQRSMITGVNVGIWVYGGTATSLDWAFTFTPFGTSFSSGTFTNFTNVWGYAAGPSSDDSTGESPASIYSESITMPPISLDPGTYYLELGNLQTTSGEGGWDINGGEGAAYQNADYSDVLGDAMGTGSEAAAFQIVGEPAPVPEPSTLLLVVGGLAAVALAKGRKKS